MKLDFYIHFIYCVLSSLSSILIPTVAGQPVTKAQVLKEIRKGFGFTFRESLASRITTMLA